MSKKIIFLSGVLALIASPLYAMDASTSQEANKYKEYPYVQPKKTYDDVKSTLQPDTTATNHQIQTLPLVNNEHPVTNPNGNVMDMPLVGNEHPAIAPGDEKGTPLAPIPTPVQPQGEANNQEDMIPKLSTANFFNACKVGEVTHLNTYLEQGAKVDMLDQDGNNGLMVAVMSGQSEIVRVLMNHKINLNQRNKQGKTAVWLAINQENLPLVATLLDGGANPNIPDTNGTTPLMLTAIKGDANLCELLLEFDIDTQAGDVNGKTAMMFAIEKQNNAVITILTPRNPKDILKQPRRVYVEKEIK